MNLYRIMIWHEDERGSVQFGNLTITKNPTFVKTDLELDIHAWFEKGLAIKRYESLPPHIEVKELKAS
jgi:hypothetical protein